MSDTRIIITKYQSHDLMCVYKDNQMVNVCVGEEHSIVGNIYVGKIKNIVKNINAAFVELGEGQLTYFSMNKETPIFLNAKNSPKPVVGDEILVQVVKDGIKTKNPQVSSNMTLVGKYLVLTNSDSKIGISNKIADGERKDVLKHLIQAKRQSTFGVIVRTNAETATETAILAELSDMEQQFADIFEKAPYRKAGQCLYQARNGFIEQLLPYCNDNLTEIVTDLPEIYMQLTDYFELYDEEAKQKLRFYDDDAFSLAVAYNIHKMMEQATSKRVWLKSGAYLVIEQTEALVAIDVNTGKSIGKQDMTKHFLKINLEAAVESARQIRLRNLSGIILIDFINMESKADKDKVIEALKAELQKDSVQTNYVDTTALGLVELTRKKIHRSLKEILEG